VVVGFLPRGFATADRIPVVWHSSTAPPSTKPKYALLAAEGIEPSGHRLQRPAPESLDYPVAEPSILATDAGKYGWPDGPIWPSAARSAAMARSERRLPVFGD
jgi:hypothetical protein